MGYGDEHCGYPSHEQEDVSKLYTREQHNLIGIMKQSLCCKNGLVKNKKIQEAVTVAQVNKEDALPRAEAVGKEKVGPRIV